MKLVLRRSACRIAEIIVLTHLFLATIIFASKEAYFLFIAFVKSAFDME